MEIAFSKSQKLIIQSAREFLEKEASDLARDAENTEEGYSSELWRKMANLGWMGIMFPEAYGGVEGDFFELVLILEEIGRVLVPGPFISTMISGYSVLQHGTETQKDELLHRLTKGDLILVPSFIEPDSNKGEVKIKEQIDREDGGYVLSGTKLFVPYAQLADWFIYKAGQEKDETLFLIDAKSPGVNCHLLKTIAPDRKHEVIFDKVRVPQVNILGERGQGNKLAAEIEEWGALCHSAYILGLLERVLEMTVKHAKTREQFGRPIGSFQAIQHQCADMITEVDKVKFLTYQAAWNLSRQVRSTREISMAKARASDAAQNVCLLGIKIHGGIGITEEYDLQLYFRKAKAEEIDFGDGDFHREIVARELGL